MNEKHKLADKFNPKEFEDKLYEEWESKGFFKPSDDKTKEPYCIMMPPPNVLENFIWDMLLMIQFKMF